MSVIPPKEGNINEFPCYECGALEMGHCGKVGCAAMQTSINVKNAEIERLNSALSKDVWIPVSERTPERNTPVLASGHNDGRSTKKRWYVVGKWTGKHWLDPSDTRPDVHLVTPTHWMPLPEAPK